MTDIDEKLLDGIRFIYKGIHELALQKETAYQERNQLVNVFAKMAASAGWKVWVAEHQDAPGEKPWDPEWLNVVFVDTPQGQVSWHIHEKEMDMFSWIQLRGIIIEWDEHTTEEKYRRLMALEPTMLPAPGTIDGVQLFSGVRIGVKNVDVVPDGVYTVTEGKWNK